jgi:hypothetical protein
VLPSGQCWQAPGTGQSAFFAQPAGGQEVSVAWHCPPTQRSEGQAVVSSAQVWHGMASWGQSASLRQAEPFWHSSGAQ